MSQPNRNIELKVRCEDLVAVRRRAESLGAQDRGVLHQRDVFFQSPLARLKLREFGDGTAELISYRRSDTGEPRGSDYLICPVAEPNQLAAVLSHALGTAGIVKKTRHLLLYRHTRIHLDEVDGLGSFVELETVLAGQSDADGHAELRQVAAALDLRVHDGVAEPYVELLSPSGERHRSRS
jgi:predicted adenylyl cyclase CyaB